MSFMVALLNFFELSVKSECKRSSLGFKFGNVVVDKGELSEFGSNILS
jgi:hypothetical protein